MQVFSDSPIPDGFEVVLTWLGTSLLLELLSLKKHEAPSYEKDTYLPKDGTCS